MRRAVPVIAVTVGGLALVANFRTEPDGLPLASGPGAVPLARGPSTTETTAAPGPSPTTSSAVEASGRSGLEPSRTETTTAGTSPLATTLAPTTVPAAARSVAGPAQSTPTTQSSPLRTTTSPPTTAPSVMRSVDGPAINTVFGDVQVRLTLNGRRLADVQAIQLPYHAPRSLAISRDAEPKLRAEALRAQSANINVISGATYTSEAYIDSLQGALGLAGP